MLPKITAILAFTALVVTLSCRQNHKQPISLFSPRVVEAHGYVVAKGSMGEPKIMPEPTPRIVKAGDPKTVVTHIYVHVAGKPRVVNAGAPTICTPGQGGFSLPEIVPAIHKPFIAGIPDVLTAQKAYAKYENPESFSCFGKLQGLKNAEI